jgi:diamine N-acetyltransferase
MAQEMMPEQIYFQVVTRDNWRETLTLSVTPEQERYVADYFPLALVGLAKAYVRPMGLIWVPYAICENEHMVGFVTLAFEPGSSNNYWIFHFFIDQRHQGRGYGRQALAAFIDHVRNMHPACCSISLTVHPENIRARRLYTNAGFITTGEWSLGEPVYHLALQDNA